MGRATAEAFARVYYALEATGLLHHAHWSAFQPVAGTPMEGLPAVPAAREAN